MFKKGENKMKVKWELDDGYLGASRPHWVEIPEDEFRDCTTKKEVNEVIEEFVQDDFNGRVSFVWSTDDCIAILPEELRNIIEKGEK
jgi:hypothetical protein